jgi:hypothetical protein
LTIKLFPVAGSFKEFLDNALMETGGFFKYFMLVLKKLKRKFYKICFYNHFGCD